STEPIYDPIRGKASSAVNPIAGYTKICTPSRPGVGCLLHHGYDCTEGFAGMGRGGPALPISNGHNSNGHQRKRMTLIANASSILFFLIALLWLKSMIVV